MTDAKEDTAKCLLYFTAMHALNDESPRRVWARNLECYRLWTAQQRIRWAKYIEAQAAKELPMAMQLVTKALEIRMKS